MSDRRSMLGLCVDGRLAGSDGPVFDESDESINRFGEADVELSCGEG